MIYEVLDSRGRSIYPSSGGADMMKFSGLIYPNYIALLKLDLSFSEVVMTTKDLH